MSCAFGKIFEVSLRGCSSYPNGIHKDHVKRALEIGGQNY